MNHHENARLTFARRLEMVLQMTQDSLTPTAMAFLRDAVAYSARLGVRHTFTRPCRPQTNGKAERAIQSALRESAYGIAYDHSSERTVMLAKWQLHYNWHRPHAGIGSVPPMSRLKSASGNDVLTLHN